MNINISTKPTETSRNRATNAKIRAVLDGVNGKAQSFSVTTWDQLRDFASEAEQQLSMLPKKLHVGAVAICTPAGPTARSYKYAAQSTTVGLQRRASGWFLVSAEKTTVYPKNPHRCHVVITADQRDEIQRRSTADFGVAE
tara:strand:+ start:8395 stop:8817 length:423 start_codon:yes stop_codon:yes gene_type:complete